MLFKFELLQFLLKCRNTIFLLTFRTAPFFIFELLGLFFCKGKNPNVVINIEPLWFSNLNFYVFLTLSVISKFVVFFKNPFLYQNSSLTLQWDNVSCSEMIWNYRLQRKKNPTTALWGRVLCHLPLLCLLSQGCRATGCLGRMAMCAVHSTQHPAGMPWMPLQQAAPESMTHTAKRL